MAENSSVAESSCSTPIAPSRSRTAPTSSSAKSCPVNDLLVDVKAIGPDLACPEQDGGAGGLAHARCTGLWANVLNPKAAVLIALGVPTATVS